MKRYIAFVMVVMLMGLTPAIVSAQSLAGQEFLNSNVNFMGAELSGVNDIIASKRDSLLDAKAKKLGRKLTAAEVAKVDDEIKEGQKAVSAMQKAIQMNVGVIFLSEKEVEMRMKMSVDDKALKDAGIGWLQRNALKASLKLMPKSMKEKYVRKGNLVIVSPESDPDTLRLSSDGKQLTGKFTQNQSLTRPFTKRSGLPSA